MSTLIDKLMRPVTIRIPERVDDGEGGHQTLWRDGATFQAAITAHRADWAWVAVHHTPVDYYNVTLPEDGMSLPLATVLRDADGKTYRTTSLVRDFPSVMSVRYKRYTAEEWSET
jgi:hypothetical protein